MLTYGGLFSLIKIVEQLDRASCFRWQGFSTNCHREISDRSPKPLTWCAIFTYVTDFYTL